MLILARHGRTKANAAGQLLGRRDEQLDEHGRAQASAIADALPQGVRVISSPLARCRKTASAIRTDHEIDERIIELDYGELEGELLGNVAAKTWARWREDVNWAPSRGESHARMAKRVWSLLDEISPDAADTDIVLVTHVSPIKASIAWALGVGIEVSWRCFVAQASIHRINTAGIAPSLRSMNETAHLGKCDDLVHLR